MVKSLQQRKLERRINKFRDYVRLEYQLRVFGGSAEAQEKARANLEKARRAIVDCIAQKGGA
jgi:hypothetical protein